MSYLISATNVNLILVKHYNALHFNHSVLPHSPQWLPQPRGSTPLQVHYKQLIWQNGVKLGTGKKEGPTQRQQCLRNGKKPGIERGKRRRGEAGSRNPLRATKSAHDQRNVAATLDKKPSQHLRRRRSGCELGGGGALDRSQVGGRRGSGRRSSRLAGMGWAGA